MQSITLRGHCDNDNGNKRLCSALFAPGSAIPKTEPPSRSRVNNLPLTPLHSATLEMRHQSHGFQPWLLLLLSPLFGHL